MLLHLSGKFLCEVEYGESAGAFCGVQKGRRLPILDQSDAAPECLFVSRRPCPRRGRLNILWEKQTLPFYVSYQN